MPKLTLSPLASLTNQASAIGTINANMAAIEEAFDNTLSRDGNIPNSMEADLDMDHHRLINLPEPEDPTEPLRLGDADMVLDSLDAIAVTLVACQAAQSASETAQAAAELAEANAELAETNAETAETNAELAEVNAEAAQAAAEAARDAAQTAETNAETAEANAEAAQAAAETAQAAAELAETNAETAATNAATSEANASASASAAATSATNAANSATAAQTAETNAELAETNAETAQAAAEAARDQALLIYQDLDGGTTGQVLVKESDTDFDFTWNTFTSMDATTYDPQNIAADVFDRANHTGTQTLATISDAGDLAAQDTINNDDWSGTALAVVNGGTGASDAATAFANLKQAATTSATGVTELATAAEYRSDTAGNLALTPEQAWDAMTVVGLTDAATISWDMSSGIDFSVTIVGNRTLGNPSNTTVGKRGRIAVTASGATRTLNKSSNIKSKDITWPISIASGETAYVYYDCVSSSIIIVTGVINNPA
jgi:hypothetical protein